MGYKIRVDSSMFGGANQKAIDEEVARKKKEYENNSEIVKITKVYEMKEVIKIISYFYIWYIAELLNQKKIYVSYDYSSTYKYISNKPFYSSIVVFYYRGYDTSGTQV